MSRDDDKVDEALEETFPASDPPALTVETGIRIAPAISRASVVDNPDTHRFELAVDGEVAFLQYERSARTMTIVHTEVPPSLRGRGLGDILVEAALAAARSEGLQIVAVCPFARAYLRKHPQALK